MVIYSARQYNRVLHMPMIFFFVNPPTKEHINKRIEEWFSDAPKEGMYTAAKLVALQEDWITESVHVTEN